MKRILLFTFLACLASQTIFAQQDSTKIKKREKLNETINKLPEMLLAGKDNSNDSSMYFLKNDVLVMSVPPLWQEKGTQMLNDLKLQKINEDPLNATFPLPERNNLTNGLTITMSSYKKTPDEKKQALFAQVKKDLAQLYKDAGKAVSADEQAAQVKDLITGPEAFTTNEGKTGELYLVNDIATQQSSFLVVLIMPGLKPGTCYYTQFNYYHYNYDVAASDDLTQLKVFGYPDDLEAYVNFTKGLLKTIKAP